MSTINQKVYNCSNKRKRKYFLRGLNKCPQKRGVCLRVYTTSPKKPNSAVRKIAKVKLLSNRLKPQVLAGIPGIGHSLQVYGIVLIRGGRVNDVPGVRYKLIRGKYDFIADESFLRKNRRSKYGVRSY